MRLTIARLERDVWVMQQLLFHFPTGLDCLIVHRDTYVTNLTMYFSAKLTALIKTSFYEEQIHRELNHGYGLFACQMCSIQRKQNKIEDTVRTLASGVVILTRDREYRWR